MRPVVQELEGLTLVDFPHEGEREQECGDEEEDVHAAGDLTHPHVVDYDKQHCERA